MKTDAIDGLIESYGTSESLLVDDVSEAQAELTELKRLARLGSLLEWLCERAVDYCKTHLMFVGLKMDEHDIFPVKDCTQFPGMSALEAIEHRAKEEGWEG